ncbi:MAG: hypothetical protein A2W93_01560 [Bacteroidetes bacterium GWF2_43_63]|nr:MAG: hypothetical protein A2W93_01560 [Bacteroidetes bacterium GWF2_43_63]HBG71330.1 hypothetical protein [Bacteroidales bacterium]
MSQNDSFCKHNIPSSDGDEGGRGYGIVMFAAKPTAGPPSGGIPCSTMLSGSLSHYGVNRITVLLFC